MPSRPVDVARLANLLLELFLDIGGGREPSGREPSIACVN